MSNIYNPHPRPVRVDWEATVREDDVPVLVTTFHDVLGETLALDLTESLCLDLLIGTTRFLHQLHRPAR